MEYKIAEWFWDAKEDSSGNEHPAPKLLREGWRPQGGVFVQKVGRELRGEADYYTQAFVRENPQPQLRPFWRWVFYRE